MGVPLGWISQQRGPANVGITAQHYAQWIEPHSGAWKPTVPEEGELPVDLLSRIYDEELMIKRLRALMERDQ